MKVKHVLKLACIFVWFSVNLSCTKKPNADLSQTTNIVSGKGFLAESMSEAVELNWQSESGAEYLVVQTDGEVSIIPPEIDYTFVHVGQVFGNNKIIYWGADKQLTVGQLQNGSIYLFTLYQVKGPGTFEKISELKVTVGLGTGTSKQGPKRITSLSIHAADGKLQLEWTAGGGQTGYLVLRSLNPITFLPVRGTQYTLGQTVETSTVAYVGNSTSFWNEGLTNNTRYHYAIYAFDANYNYSTGFSGYRTPFKNAAQSPTLTATPTQGGIALNWTLGTSSPLGAVLLKRNAGTPAGSVAALSNGKAYQVGDVSEDGGYTVIYVGTETTYTDVNVKNNVTSYYTIFIYLAGSNYSKYTAGAGAVQVEPTIDQSQETPLAPTLCKMHAGQPYPWEGSGACTGNLMTIISILGTGYELIHNSHDATTDYGFGNGFRLSIDRRIKLKSQSELVVEDGDGSSVPYSLVGGTWSSKNLALSRNILSFTNSEATETTRSGTVYQYRKLSNTSNFGLVKVTFLNGNTITITRTSAGKITSSLDSFGKGISLTYKSGQVESINTHLNYLYELSYSGTQLTQIKYHASSEQLVWRFEYKNSSSMNAITSVIDSLGGETNFEYGSTSYLLTQIKNPLKYKTTIDYSDKKVTVSSIGGALIEQFNDQGQLITSTDNNIKSQFTRNQMGQLLTYTDHFGVQTSFTYDTEFRPISAASTTGLSLLYERQNGDITKKTLSGSNGTSVVTQYTYDSNHRLTSLSGPGTNQATFSYDAKGNLTNATVNGRNEIQASYTSKNLLSSLTLENGSQNFSYTYLTNGNIQKITTPVGAFTFAYLNTAAGLGAPNYINGPGGTIEQNVDGLGRPLYYTGYDKAGTRLTYQGDTTAVSGKVNAKIKRNHELHEVSVPDADGKDTVIYRKTFLKGE